MGCSRDAEFVRKTKLRGQQYRRSSINLQIASEAVVIAIQSC